ncbi:MAG: NAD(P)H-dependent oxidoreductase [Armatimonadetes bacterium]|nr:NAD(P)H-dependent oxidoreductase [Armatimonadota bacterium]
MKILGLIGSRRKLGNTEIIVKEIARNCMEKGAEVNFIRLSDLKIESCSGCMQCVFKASPCPLKDDFYFLLEKIKEAEGIILGTPTYLLAPSGIIKLILDRLYIANSKDRKNFLNKKAVTFAIAGIKNWAPLSLPLLNLFPLFLNFKLIYSFILYAPGPGEILLDKEYLKETKIAGELLIKGEDNVLTLSNSCPICKGAFFIFKEQNQIECPFCQIKGEIKQSKIVFPSISEHRFTYASLENHTENWVKATEGSFQNHLKEILALRKPYKEMDKFFIKPPSFKINEEYQNNLSKALLFFEAVNEKNWDKLLDGFSQEACLIFPGSAPLSGIYRGKEEIKRYFRRMNIAVPNLKFIIKEVFNHSHSIIIEWENHGLTRKRKNYNNQGITILKLKAGKIIYLRDYLDTEQLKQ